MPLPSKAAVLRFARGPGSGNDWTAKVAGSTRTIAFVPPSVTHAPPSGPIITPWGAAPAGSCTSSTVPVAVSTRPIVALRWPVYQTRPSACTATSCGPEPGATGNSSITGSGIGAAASDGVGDGAVAGV